MSLALFYNFATGSDIIALAVTFSYCIYIFKCKNDYLLPSMIYMSLFAYLFNYNSYNLLFFVTSAYLFRSFQSPVFPKNKFVGILIIYFITHLIATSSGINIALMSMFLALLSIFCASLQVTYKIGLLVQHSFIISFILSSILGMFKEGTRLAEMLTADEVYETIRFSGLSYDPNFYTVISIIAIFLIINLMRKNSRIINYVLLLIVLFFGMQTLSKSFYISAVVLVLYSIKAAESKMKYGLFLGIVFIAVLPYFLDKIMPMLNIMFQRLESGQDASSLTTGRSDLWRYYQELIFGDSFSFLIGHGAVMQKGMDAAHNTYLELLYKFGIIGTLVDAYLIYVSFKNIKVSIGHTQFKSFLFFGLFAAMMFNLSAYSFPALWSCLVVVAIAGYLDINNEKQIITS